MPNLAVTTTWALHSTGETLKYGGKDRRKRHKELRSGLELDTGDSSTKTTKLTPYYTSDRKKIVPPTAHLEKLIPNICTPSQNFWKFCKKKNPNCDSCQWKPSYCLDRFASFWSRCSHSYRAFLLRFRHCLTWSRIALWESIMAATAPKWVTVRRRNASSAFGRMNAFPRRWTQKQWSLQHCEWKNEGGGGLGTLCWTVLCEDGNTKVQDPIVHIDRWSTGASCQAAHIKAVCSCYRVGCVLTADKRPCFEKASTIDPGVKTT